MAGAPPPCPSLHLPLLSRPAPPTTYVRAHLLRPPAHTIEGDCGGRERRSVERHILPRGRGRGTDRGTAFPPAVGCSKTLATPISWPVDPSPQGHSLHVPPPACPSPRASKEAWAYHPPAPLAAALARAPTPADNEGRGRHIRGRAGEAATAEAPPPHVDASFFTTAGSPLVDLTRHSFREPQRWSSRRSRRRHRRRRPCRRLRRRYRRHRCGYTPPPPSPQLTNDAVPRLPPLAAPRSTAEADARPPAAWGTGA